MLKSLYAGVSGMKGFQTKLDVIGNNIANVNTVGFKKDRVMFQDIINQTLTGAGGATNQAGGVNPKQVGLGSSIATIDTLHTPGSPMSTNVATDLAIDGDAYFVIDGGNGSNYLTRAGNFTRDSNGDLVNGNGNFVVGVAIENPPANSPAGTLGTQHQLNINISVDETSNRDAAGAVILDGNNNPTEPLKFTSYSIDSNGYINVVREDGVSGQLAMKLDPADPNVGLLYLNTGGLNTNENISIATSVVPNASGLKKVGSSMYEETANSGLADFGRIEDNSGGQITPGILEMSNVDLTEEFTEMIVAQRGFQANSRIITTSDSILEEIVNLKR